MEAPREEYTKYSENERVLERERERERDREGKGYLEIGTGRYMIPKTKHVLQQQKQQFLLIIKHDYF